MKALRVQLIRFTFCMEKNTTRVAVGSDYADICPSESEEFSTIYLDFRSGLKLLAHHQSHRRQLADQTQDSKEQFQCLETLRRKLSNRLWSVNALCGSARCAEKFVPAKMD